jgi:tetratricopeptide (TPR) repeat protein
MPDVWVPMLLVVSLGGWAVVLMIKRPEYAIWTTLSAGGILLVSNMFVVTGTIFAERLLYIPALGFSMALGRLLNRLPARIQIYFIASWICITVCILWGRGVDWRSELTLFTSAVEVHPLSARSHYGLALALHRESKLRPALKEYDQALNLYPRYFEARLNRGAVLLELGKYPDAIAAYRDVVDQRPMHFQGRYALALLEFNFGDRSLAKSMLWQLHGEFPRRIDLLCDLVRLLAGQGDRTEVLRLLEEGLILEPANEDLLLLEQTINPGVD